MKILYFDGYLAADAEAGQTSKGSKYLRFKVGCNSFVMGEKKTDWIEVISFNDSENEVMGKYLKKGCHVVVVGTPNTTCNVGKDGRQYVNTSVRAYHMEFGNSGGGKSDKRSEDEPEISVNPQSAPSQAETDYSEIERSVSQTVQPQPQAEGDGDDDELPF
jgi:single-stranded DNA-binding protein